MLSMPSPGFSILFLSNPIPSSHKERNNLSPIWRTLNLALLVPLCFFKF
jgi:hypothetical protein